MVTTPSAAEHAQRDNDVKHRNRTQERVRATNLSRQLQTRLQYMRLKVERGWQKQSLNEVENLYFHHSLNGSRTIPGTNLRWAAPISRPSTIDAILPGPVDDTNKPVAERDSKDIPGLHAFHVVVLSSETSNQFSAPAADRNDIPPMLDTDSVVVWEPQPESNATAQTDALLTNNANNSDGLLPSATITSNAETSVLRDEQTGTSKVQSTAAQAILIANVEHNIVANVASAQPDAVAAVAPSFGQGNQIGSPFSAIPAAIGHYPSFMHLESPTSIRLLSAHFAASHVPQLGIASTPPTYDAFWSSHVGSPRAFRASQTTVDGNL